MNDIQRGEAAKRILNDEVVLEAFEQIELGLMQVWRQARSTEDREEVWYTLRGFELFKQCFETTISNGQFEQIKNDTSH